MGLLGNHTHSTEKIGTYTPNWSKNTSPPKRTINNNYTMNMHFTTTRVPSDSPRSLTTAHIPRMDHHRSLCLAAPSAPSPCVFCFSVRGAIHTNRRTRGSGTFHHLHHLRAHLLPRQREMGEKGGMDGGTRKEQVAVDKT